MPEPNEAPDKDQPLLPKQRCRFIKTGGEQCRSLAMTGNHFCWHHRWYRKPHFTGVKGYDRVGFLEDVTAVQLILSQSMQGLIDRTLDPNLARTLFYGCQVASGLVRLDMAHQRWLAENKQQPEEPVREATNLDSDPLAPPQEYRGPAGEFEPYWSFSKYMYEQQCEKEGRPKPTSPADMPPSGWMDEEEYFEDAGEWTKRYDEKIKTAREQAAAAADKGTAPSGTIAESTATEPTATEPTATEPTATEPTAAESPTKASQKNECHSERSEEPPEPREGLASHSGAPLDLQAAAAVPERHTRSAQRSSEPYTPNPDPCSYFRKREHPNQPSATIALHAVAAPERSSTPYPLPPIPCRRAVMRDAHYFLTQAASNNYTTVPNQGSPQAKKALNRAGE